MSRELAQWLERLERAHPDEIELGLERCGTVWRRLEQPRPAGRIITVAGTNGKGSVVAYCDALLRIAGHRSGTYTSPHLFEFTERVTIDGESLDASRWVAAFERVERARSEPEPVSLTYFEFTTLAAFLLMHEAGLDVAVLEVGLGGRLDAVNLIDADVAVITRVDLDHQAWLGDDREAIGREKAGILRPDRPVVLAETEPPQSILDTAEQLGAVIHRGGGAFRIEAADGVEVLYLPKGEVALPEAAAVGAHQRENLAAAVMAVTLLVEQPSDGAVAAVAQSVRPPGRMQQVASSPDIWVDVGHNPLAARAVAAFLSERNIGGPVVAVIGMLRDKDPPDFAAALVPVVRRFVCIGLEGSRGGSADWLAARIENAVGSAPIETAPNIDEALKRAREVAGHDGAVIVLGSFLTASAALRSGSTRPDGDC